MKCNLIRFLPLCVTILFSILYSGCSSVKELESLKPEGNITIDGKDNDWKEGLIQQDNALIGFRSDEKELYCVFITGDRGKGRKLMMGGMTVFFENVETKQKIGIKYPEGFNPKEIKEMRPEGGLSENTEPAREIDRPIRNPSKSISILDKSGNQVSQIFNDDDNKIVAAYTMDGRFISELKIPLTGSGTGFTVPAKAGEQVLISFQSSEIDRKKMREKMREANGGVGGEDDGSMPGAGRPPGGGQGRQGGMRPGGGQGGERMRPDSGVDKKIEITFKVRLQK
ncbi:MAG: hypothetical protein HYV28_04450 [Ignavibacteriales bacterium]|nr:hypothetical protein [Ignavibacteriales bacterium]